MRLLRLRGLLIRDGDVALVVGEAEEHGTEHQDVPAVLTEESERWSRDGIEGVGWGHPLHALHDEQTGCSETVPSTHRTLGPAGLLFNNLRDPSNLF